MTLLSRDTYLDHLRGFMFALMAFDHALHAYAQDWGKFWFFQDYDRSIVWDGFYLFDQSIIMPMIFFISGLYVIPSLEKHKFFPYIGRRFIKLGIPFLVCIPLIVPLLIFPRYLQNVDSSMEFNYFWQNIFFTERLQAGPLWVCYGLFLYSLLLILFHKIGLISALGRWVQRVVLHSPFQGFLGIIGVSALILGISDLIWGAPWWFGFWQVFYLQGARFLLYFLYFVLGGAVYCSGILKNPEFLKALANKWPLWCIGMTILGVAYVGYSLVFKEEGAYSDDFRYSLQYFFQEGGTWDHLWDFMSTTGFDRLQETAPAIWVRTTLHGILCLFQVLFLLSFFYRFCNQPTPLWQSLARNCYGIFLTHEAIVIWLQYSLNGFELPTGLKIAFIFCVGLGSSWFLSDRLLLKIPGVRRVLNSNN